MKIKLTEDDIVDDNYVIKVELPGGVQLSIIVPEFERDYPWCKPDVETVYGLNLVTDGHYC